jgi:hypothetical protein
MNTPNLAKLRRWIQDRISEQQPHGGFESGLIAAYRSVLDEMSRLFRDKWVECVDSDEINSLHKVIDESDTIGKAFEVKYEGEPVADVYLRAFKAYVDWLAFRQQFVHGRERKVMKTCGTCQHVGGNTIIRCGSDPDYPAGACPVYSQTSESAMTPERLAEIEQLTQDPQEKPQPCENCTMSTVFRERHCLEFYGSVNCSYMPQDVLTQEVDRACRAIKDDE